MKQSDIYNRMFRLYLLAGFIFLCSSIHAQWKFDFGANIGANFSINYNKNAKFPTFRLFGAVNIYGKRDKHFVVQYSPSVSLYKNAIGTNLTPLKSDYSFDFMNTFCIGFETKDSSFVKHARSMHNGDYYNLQVKSTGGVMLFSNFIVNNKKVRNQVNGGLLATIDRVSLLYYNDGVPFDFMALSDGFDRYWTGGGGLFWHKENYNILEFTYDQFTGYKPLIYELSTLIGIDVPFSSGNIENYNTSAYNLKIGLDKNFSADIGIIGSLIDKSGRFWGFQDVIHLLGKYALHPNSDPTKYYIGANGRHFIK